MDRDTSSAFVNITHFFDNDWSIKAEYENRNDNIDGKLMYMRDAIDKPSGYGMQASVTNYISDRDLQSARIFASGSFDLLDRQQKLMVGAIQTKQDIYAFSHIPLSPVEVGNFFQWNGSVAEPEFQLKNIFKLLILKSNQRLI